MWTSDIIHALNRFQEQFGDGNTVCIGNIEVGLFGHLIIRYDTYLYVFLVKEDKWFKREG